MDYPPEFWIKYVAVCLEEYYGNKVTLDKKLQPHYSPEKYTPEQLDKAEGFIKGFVEGISFL